MVVFLWELLIFLPYFFFCFFLSAGLFSTSARLYFIIGKTFFCISEIPAYSIAILWCVSSIFDCFSTILFSNPTIINRNSARLDCIYVRPDCISEKFSCISAGLLIVVWSSQILGHNWYSDKVASLVNFSTKPCLIPAGLDGNLSSCFCLLVTLPILTIQVDKQNLHNCDNNILANYNYSLVFVYTSWPTKDE